MVRPNPKGEASSRKLNELGLTPFRMQSIFEVVGGLIEDNLPQTTIGISFRQELGKTLSHWTLCETRAPDIGNLPILACEAIGGDARAAEPVTAAWQLVRLAAKLLDDIEDGEVKRCIGVTINTATSLTFVADLTLDWLSAYCPQDIVRQVSLELQRAMLRAAAGQHADLQGDQSEPHQADPDAWLQIARAKSGDLLGWAAWAGALVAGANVQALACLREYGSHLGVLLQIADDWYGIWAPDGAADLMGRHLNLAVCYARAVLKEQAREHFEVLLSQAEDHRSAEREAVELVTALGAQAYLLAIGRIEYGSAVAALQKVQAPLSGGGPLVNLLDGVMPIVGTLRV